MTDRSRFEDAFAGFRSLPYPPYPALEALRDWNSDLLTLDGHVAGYASQVHGGSMQAWEIPHLAGLVAEVDALRAALDAVDDGSGDDRAMIAAFRDYVSAMQAMMHELDRLAAPGVYR
ncbi:hypothetical protein [Kitasatospora sp. NPDC051914]|uniref:hypothetical protein n=1 Tax=Kitasatospora sp. NPDC051914 TaxID=3154945 RepID=UPI00343F40CA